MSARERRRKKTKENKRKRTSTFALGASFDLSRARLSRADFEVAGYLWLDVLEVDINVGYCKHLTVRISIRRQPDAQPLERVKRVTLRRTSSQRISRGVHPRRCVCSAATRSTRASVTWVRATKVRANVNDIFPMIFVYSFVSRSTDRFEIKFTKYNNSQ